MNRAGVEPGAPVAALAEAIARMPASASAGVMGWESQAVAIADPAEKERVVAAAVGLLTASAEACRRAGHDVAIVSCGGTGTFPYCAQQPGVTEIQVGGAIFSDMHYRNHYHVDFPLRADRAGDGHQPADADPHRPRCRQEGDERRCGDAAAARARGVRFVRLSAEHATIELEAPSESRGRRHARDGRRLFRYHRASPRDDRRHPRAGGSKRCGGRRAGPHQVTRA